MSTIITNPQFGTAPLPTRRFTVDEYHRMIETGILTENDDVELLEGWIVPKMARNPPHDTGIEIARDSLARRLPAGWSMRSQSAITTADSEPEPDVSVVRGEPRTYRHRHPGPADIGLLIEVSEATLAYDRGEKGRIYARAGILYYWIVKLVNQRLEVYSDPDVGSPTPVYRQHTDYRPADQVPLILDGQTVAMIPVAELLPSPSPGVPMKLLRYLLNELLYWTFLIDIRSWSRKQPHVEWDDAGLKDDESPSSAR